MRQTIHLQHIDIKYGDTLIINGNGCQMSRNIICDEFTRIFIKVDRLTDASEIHIPEMVCVYKLFVDKHSLV